MSSIGAGTHAAIVRLAVAAERIAGALESIVKAYVDEPERDDAGAEAALVENLREWLERPGEGEAVVVVENHEGVNRLSMALGVYNGGSPCRIARRPERVVYVFTETGKDVGVVGRRFDAAFLFTDGRVAQEALRRVRPA